MYIWSVSMLGIQDPAEVRAGLETVIKCLDSSVHGC